MNSHKIKNKNIKNLAGHVCGQMYQSVCTINCRTMCTHNPMICVQRFLVRHKQNDQTQSKHNVCPFSS